MIVMGGKVGGAVLVKRLSKDHDSSGEIGILGLGGKDEGQGKASMWQVKMLQEICYVVDVCILSYVCMLMYLCMLMYVCMLCC